MNTLTDKRNAFYAWSRQLLTFGMVLMAFAAIGLNRASAQYAYFSRPTDTIAIKGTVSLNNAATYEAIVLPTSQGVSHVFNEWDGAHDDKLLACGLTGIYGYGFPINQPNALSAVVNVAPSTFHHIAYVYDGAQERLYLDGVLQTFRAASGSIGNSSSAVSAVGAIFRDGYIHGGCQGYIDTLRISNIVRYSGNSFTPPTGDLGSDANTLLLYNFDEPTGSKTITDLSGNGHTGTLGTGFSGATSPQLGVGTVTSFMISPTAVVGGFETALATVTLSFPPATSPIDIYLTDTDKKAAAVPAKIVFRKGQQVATFTINTAFVLADTSVTITAADATADLTVQASLLTKLGLSFSPVSTGYQRGAVITATATLKDSSGNPVPSESVIFEQQVESTGQTTVLGFGMTNAQGQLSITYTVPTDTSENNIYIHAIFPGSSPYQNSTISRYVPIK